jgi:hypothetical protein
MPTKMKKSTESEDGEKSFVAMRISGRSLPSTAIATKKNLSDPIEVQPAITDLLLACRLEELDLQRKLLCWIQSFVELGDERLPGAGDLHSRVLGSRYRLLKLLVQLRRVARDFKKETPDR